MHPYKKIVFVVGCLLFIIQACNRYQVPAKDLVIYPSPPDTVRFQYLTSFSNSLDITRKRTAFQKSVLGEDVGMPIGKPYGIATGAGKLFICDPTIRGLEIVEPGKRLFTQFIPSGKGQLKQPINCFLDIDNTLYVTDIERKQVVIFDAELKYVTAIGNTDTADNFRPLDVCVSDTKIWVTNPKMNKINIYQKDGFKLLRSIPDTTVSEVRLYNPINICYMNGRIYVTDFGDFKIKIFSEEGKYQGSVGEYGKGLGQFVRPKGIAVDKEGNLFVVDAGFENVQVFNTNGKLLMSFGGPYKKPGDMWLPAKVHIDYLNLSLYQKEVSPDYEMKYLVFVSNQYGPDKISVYAAVKPKPGK